MRPDNSSSSRRDPSLVASALAAEGKAYAIYLHVPLPPKPKNLADHLRTGVIAEVKLNLSMGTFDVVWIDTKTGHQSKSSTDHSGGPLSLTTPPFDNDIALKLTRR